MMYRVSIWCYATHNAVAPVGRNDAMFAKIIRRSRHHSRSEHHLQKANIIPKIKASLSTCFYFCVYSTKMQTVYFSEIFGLRRMWNNSLCELWDLMLTHQVKWNKSTHARRHFTLRSNISLPKAISQIPKGIYFVENKKHCFRSAFCFLEVPPRFELGNESFADSCLTTWPRYHMK